MIWREIMTRAYGRRIIFIKLAFLVIAAFIFSQSIMGGGGELVLGMLSVRRSRFSAGDSRSAADQCSGGDVDHQRT